MSADIEKLAVFDSRIVQSRPKYAVEKGALSLTNAPFVAIAATASQHTYNIYVPSENVYVQRKIDWTSDILLKFQITIAAGAGTARVADEPLIGPGQIAPCAFPLNFLVSTLSATINDTTSVINSQDVLYEVLRLADSDKNHLVRTTPTFLDTYQSYSDSTGAQNSPLNVYSESATRDTQPNAAFTGFVFTLPDGSVPAVTTAVPVVAGGNPTAYSLVRLANGATVPCAVAGSLSGTFELYVKLSVVEPLVLSPFVFSDTHRMDTGLFGINNIQLVMNLKSNVSRVLRFNTNQVGNSKPFTLTANQLPSLNTATPFGTPRVNVQFLTPSLDVPLPPKSVVPYMEFPRFIYTYNTAVAAGATAQINSQTITLPQIPDLLIIYAKPTPGAAGAGEYTPLLGDYYLPIASNRDNVANPLSINFDNFSGLLSAHTQQELYEMSVRNGLRMDYNTWCGEAVSSIPQPGGAAAGTAAGAARVPMVGGPLILKPGRDITLQSGQAPSLVGNFTLQFNITVKNTTRASIASVQLYVITVNSGFFESIRGSSRIIKGVLSEQDIISAPVAPMGDTESLARYVGGFSFSSLGNILSKAKDIYHATKPIVSAVKGALPEDGMAGKVKSALSAVGYGAAGGAGTGAGMGAGRAGAGSKKSLAARLM